MAAQWFSTDLLDKQEIQVTSQTQETFGKGRYGFSDFSLDGIDLLLHGIHYLRNVDESLNERGEFKDYEMAIRTRVYYDLYHISLTYKAIYNVAHQGYYREAAILLRHVLESIVSLKYLHKQKDIKLINVTWAGHHGYEGEKSRVRLITMFDSVAPGLYNHYRLLRDMAHGAFAAHLLKTAKVNHGQRKITLDDGLVFKAQECSFVINQCTVYLFAHIRFMMVIFPEIEMNMTRSYAAKYKKIMSKFEAVMKCFAEAEQNKKWYDVVVQLWE